MHENDRMNIRMQYNDRMNIRMHDNDRMNIRMQYNDQMRGYLYAMWQLHIIMQHNDKMHIWRGICRDLYITYIIFFERKPFHVEFLKVLAYIYTL